MTEKEKALAGYLYDANFDTEMIDDRLHSQELCFDFNRCRPSDTAGQQALLKKLLGKMGDTCTITAPFYCDCGQQITLGDGFYANHNCMVIGCALVRFGANVFVGPNCCFSTAGHPFDREQRRAGLEIALPITVGDDVWFGAGVTVLPGVTIGAGAVIGAGSIVTRDIPPDVIAAGNPCRVLRPITDADRARYPHA